MRAALENRSLRSVAAVLALLGLAACGPGGPSAREVATTYADVLHASYDDAVTGARDGRWSSRCSGR